MKNQQKQQAQQLYYRANMSRSEIAVAVGVNRRTIMLWAKQGNWDALRLSAQQLSVVTQCLVDRYTRELLQDTGLCIGPRHANTIYKLASSIKKLRVQPSAQEVKEMIQVLKKKMNAKCSPL